MVKPVYPYSSWWWWSGGGGGISTQLVYEEPLPCAKDAKTVRLQRGSVALLIRAPNGPI